MNNKIEGMGFHHIALKSKDIEATASFYEQLGMTLTASWGCGKNEVRMYDFGDGGKLEIFADGGEQFSEQGKYIHFALKVIDVDKAYQTALEAGGMPLREPSVVTLPSSPDPLSIHIAFVLGPDGEQVEFFREVV